MDSTFILGSGIIGVATAYYLSDHQPPSSIHLVEPCPELFASASGFAGGFLAKDWFPRETDSLGQLSFSQHRKLAEENDGRRRWGYAESTSFSHAPKPARTGEESVYGGRGAGQNGATYLDTTPSGDHVPRWLRRELGDDVQVLANDTAQIVPINLCRFLLDACIARGVQLHHPAVALSIRTDAVHGELSSIRIADTTSSTETDFPCTRILIAAGAWSPRVFATLFPSSTTEIPVGSLAGYSLVLSSPFPEDTCAAVFSADANGLSPELFSRADGSIYIAGINSPAEALPDSPTEARLAPEKVAELRDIARGLFWRGRDKEEESDGGIDVIKEGLCFRPTTQRGVPFVCRLRDELLGPDVSTRSGCDGGVYLAAGHGPWGISLGLGTGLVVAEMMQGRPLSADVSGLTL